MQGLLRSRHRRPKKGRSPLEPRPIRRGPAPRRIGEEGGSVGYSTLYGAGALAKGHGSGDRRKPTPRLNGTHRRSHRSPQGVRARRAHHQNRHVPIGGRAVSNTASPLLWTPQKEEGARARIGPTQDIGPGLSGAPALFRARPRPSFAYLGNWASQNARFLQSCGRVHR